MPIYDAPDDGAAPGGVVAECPRCETTSTAADVETAKQWLAAHWREHDHEIGCGRRG